MKKVLNHRRIWKARILLAVFIPMLLLSVTHIHHESERSEQACYECLHHINHAGHITNQTVSIDHCILCSFLSLPYITPTILVAALTAVYSYVCFGLKRTVILKQRITGVGLRAPPFFSFS
ncbi:MULTISPECIES: hypothetical protein [Segatella]|uniref:hypothetical protein n=1 Tax=Segatella TaxID=2974251 RepID=UPI00115FF4A3|nr:MULTISPECIES: hypothetical protein [Segatella]MBQ3857149.1 hypothetical protein [Prevotella sp.]MDR4931895.1 hypothetical protein [Segatella bryantii]UKK75037.1 hypothetical protein L6471_00700 [Segatella bryantii]UKK79541.1 hypothetical protein L6469_14490 [Segatella baroniae B14]UKK82081.1 hypothetical protein L6474_13355 [Segatella bryantii]